ncbi:hypothetical protein BJY01DRAFT_248757 [Aspergillus pseudoustus]|uniref:Uncharacterized protein n=1 Tax=Aspergillus pseudoustus TaxID=1810923 RepID=A0ABR4JSZ8_9EURO
MGLPLLAPTGIDLSYPFLPEPPRYLFYRGRYNEAEAAVKDLYGSNYNAAEEVQLLRLRVKEQRELHKATSILDCFRGTNRCQTIIAMGVQILQQAQGVSFINNYIVTFMTQLGFADPLKYIQSEYAAKKAPRVHNNATDNELPERGNSGGFEDNANRQQTRHHQQRWFAAQVLAQPRRNQTSKDDAGRPCPRGGRLLFGGDTVIPKGRIPRAVILTEKRQAQCTAPLVIVEAEAQGSQRDEASDEDEPETKLLVKRGLRDCFEPLFLVIWGNSQDR